MFGRTKEAEVMLIEKPTTYKPNTISEVALKEYTELAEKAGVKVTQLECHRFQRFLNDHDIPVFNLPQVVKYLDAKVQQENKGWGWVWKPLRQKDKLNVSFGSWARPRSDFYTANECPVYGHQIPLNALKKVVLIEENFHDEVKMFVSDYVSANPDPFLMALIAGEGLVHRYVIDFWDEPGFGLASQLK